MAGKGSGVPRGACPPPVGKTSPAHASGAPSEREGPWAGPPVDLSREIGSCSEPELPPRFPDPTNRGTKNAGDGAISAHRHSPRGGRSPKRQEGTAETAKDGSGSSHRRLGEWRRRERRGY